MCIVPVRRDKLYEKVHFWGHQTNVQQKQGVSQFQTMRAEKLIFRWGKQTIINTTNVYAKKWQVLTWFSP